MQNVVIFRMKINEIFGKNTIQGEGPYIGQPATFVRTFGCVMPFCDFCDSKHSWKDNAKESHEMSIDEVVGNVKSFGNKLVVITGGEPYAQNETYDLVDKLLEKSYKVQMETSGKSPILYRPENEKFTIIMSPKQFNNSFAIANESTVKKADYYKFVLETPKEMDNIMNFIKQYNININQVYLMPKGSTREKQINNSDYVIEQCAKYGMTYGSRLHILLNDSKRGV